MSHQRERCALSISAAIGASFVKSRICASQTRSGPNRFRMRRRDGGRRKSKQPREAERATARRLMGLWRERPFWRGRPIRRERLIWRKAQIWREARRRRRSGRPGRLGAPRRSEATTPSRASLKTLTANGARSRQDGKGAGEATREGRSQPVPHN
eukprot:6201681-Pleurochrysis_carterae.AAC.1